MTQAELDKRLRDHHRWSETNGKYGQPLSLINIDLSKLSLYKAQLRGANFSQCILDHCDLRESNLNSINISESSFVGANLSYANLSSADCKYIKIDETTCFDECIYENMMIDLPTSELLPVFMDRTVMQIIEEYRIVTKITLNREMAHIGRSILDDFSDVIQAKYENIKVKQERKGFNEISLNYEATNIEDRDKIEQELFNFSRVLRGEIGLEKLTNDPILLDRIDFNNRVRGVQLKMQNELLLTTNKDIEQKLTTMADIVNQLAGQMKNNLLPAGANTTVKADFIVTLPNGNKKAIEADDIVYIVKTIEHDYPLIYTTKGDTIKVDELISNLATKLLIVRPTIITIHRSYIVNLTFVNRKDNDGNTYKIYTTQYPDTPLLVGQNHKKRFNEAIIQYGILLDVDTNE
jgi:LytTr DNA-binding domain/Pentapeptide repeats (9 copies)